MEKDILDQDFVGKKPEPFFKPRAILIWASVLIIGLGLKFMHWPFAAVLIIVSGAGLQAYCLIAFINPKERDPLNMVLSIVGWIWNAILIWGIYFNGGHPYNKNGLMVYGAFFVVFCIVYFLLSSRKRRRFNKTSTPG